jgi:GT2 family glycosyltransferase
VSGAPPPPLPERPQPKRNWTASVQDAWRAGNAAADPQEAIAWLLRASRILPTDDMVGISLALAYLRADDPASAAALFAPIAERYDLLDAWTGLAACALRTGDIATAETAMHAVLSRHAVPSVYHVLAASVAQAAGRPGWCAIGPDGRLAADAPAQIVLDGHPITARWSAGQCRLPEGDCVAVSRDGIALLGSPIDRTAIAAIEGFVTAEKGGLTGWAWHPNDPARDPVISVAGHRITAREPLEDPDFGRPMARPRRFTIPAAALPTGLLDVTGAGGRALLGSPIDPGLEQRSAAGLDTGFTPVWADVTGPARTSPSKRRPIDVVVPVYRGLNLTMACLHSVLATLPPGSRLHIIDDAGPDPALAAAITRLATTDRRCRLVRLDRNRGFPGAANTGLRAAKGRDVILLNSDTVVPPGWVEALAGTLHSAPDIGSACPLSNDATILSYPDREGSNPMTDPGPMAALARRANGDATVDIPVSVGFCMIIRHDCLADVGLLREDLFAQGYGEENDWCLRARHRGWRHVAVTGCFVTHAGGASFGAGRRHLLARNGAVLNRLHPGYDALVAAWIAQDPLAPARRRMDTLRWRAGRKREAVILLTHGGGGGVERVINTRIAAIEAEGRRPIVIRPDGDWTVVSNGDTPNLRFRLPGEWDALLRLLRADHPILIEQHHTLGHRPDILKLAERLAIPQEMVIHDYASFCARIALVPEHLYCGEPPVTGCKACIADHGNKLSEDIEPAALVNRSAAMLAAATRVIVPAADVASRMRRHFPAIRPVVTPWEDDAAIPPPRRRRGPVRHVCIVGAIGIEKGYEVLLACVRNAAERRLDLRFTVIGYTADDDRMMKAGPVFVTGEYKEADSEALIRAQSADIAFIPSIWPETWCFTLSQAWRAGLHAVVFDLGTPAERVRQTGWGHVLPLGLPPGAINDWLLRLHRNGT